jgi:hypothetical protein
MPSKLNLKKQQIPVYMYSILFLKTVCFEPTLTYCKFVCLYLKDVPHTAVCKSKYFVC